jgi:DNA-binding NarL/FixJ family response regulator
MSTAVIRVLLADDDVPTRIGLETIVAAEPDMDVVGAASSGDEACTLAGELAPDVVLMDVRMRGTDGITATQRITSEHARGDDRPRVIVVTTFEIDDYVYRSLAAGASGFLLKRASPEEIVDAIRAVASGDALPAPSSVREIVGRFADASTDDAADRAVSDLTKRELDILTLVGRGLSNTEIAGELFLSVETVKSHVKRIYAKTGARDRAQLVIVAYETGIVPRPARDVPLTRGG